MSNVEAGDRAIIIKAPNEELARCIGHTVRVEKYALLQSVVLGDLVWECTSESDMLAQRLDLKNGTNETIAIPRGETLFMGDEFLKPLRDTDEEDEMVSIMKNKEKEDATV